MITQTEAVILSAISYGDSSRIVKAFTRSHGLLSFVAKGAKTAKSKLGSSLLPMSVAELIFNFRDGKELLILSSADLVFTPAAINRDMEKLAVGLSINELALQTQQQHYPNEKVYEALQAALAGLGEDGSSPRAILVRFLVDYAESLGYELQFTWLHSSEAVYDEKTRVNVRISDCRLSTSESFFGQLSVEMEVGSLLIIKNIRDNAQQPVSAIWFSMILNFFIKYYSYHFDKKIRFRSLELLETREKA